MGVEDIRAGGMILPDIWEILQGGGVGDPNVWIRDLGNITQDWEDPGRVPSQGDLSAGEDASEEVHDGQVALPTFGRVNGSSRSGGGGDVRPPPLEYHRPVYYQLEDNGDLSSDREKDRSAGDNEMVGASQP